MFGNPWLLRWDSRLNSTLGLIWSEVSNLNHCTIPPPLPPENLSEYIRWNCNRLKIHIQSNLYKLNLTGTNFCVGNRQVFELYRLYLLRFPTLRLYFTIGLNRIPVYSRFGLETFDCKITSERPIMKILVYSVCRVKPALKGTSI